MSFTANDWDLHDMHGNVIEWVQDCWHDSYEGAPNDGSVWSEEDGGDCSVRVLRGGSWLYGQDGARSAARGRYAPDFRDDRIGFRVLCSPPSSTTVS
jgi:sulfatase modifying factor 1